MHGLIQAWYTDPAFANKIAYMIYAPVHTSYVFTLYTRGCSKSFACINLLIFAITLKFLKGINSNH